MGVMDVSSLVGLVRPRFLLGGALFFLMGLLLAIILGAPFDLPRCLFGYAIFLAGHLSISFSNDYFDYAVDRLTKRTSLSGGSGVLFTHPSARSFAVRIAVLLIALSLTLAVLFLVIYSMNWSFLLFVLIGNLTGWFYSAPPLRLSYRGYGEILTILGAGMLMPGMGYFVASGTLDLPFLFLALPLLFYGSLFIMSVEIPDMEGDRLGGKMTFIVSHGRRVGSHIVTASAICATLLFMAYYTIRLWYPLIDWRVVSGISLIPCGISLGGLMQRPFQRPAAVRQALRTVYALMTFLILTDLYFIVEILPV